jgi:hypothetical protein
MVGKVNPDFFKTVFTKQVPYTVDNTTERRRRQTTNFVTNVNNMNCLLLLIRWNDCKITLPDVNQYNTPDIKYRYKEFLRAKYLTSNILLYLYLAKI